ncbi:MAG: transcriptional regulator, partial [Chloroflexota bacterium]|nr:transcriptional regulator [Chloroflexota bacterium]
VGTGLGREGARRRRGRRTQARLLDSALDALGEYGYEPYRSAPGEIRLRNCPFHPISRGHPELVCGMNVELVRALVDGIGLQGVTAHFEPDPEACCVVLRTDSHQDPAT